MNFQEFLGKVKDSIEKLSTLDIVTAVGPLKYDSVKKTYEAPESGAASVMRTRIDLLQGDITTQLDEEFATGRYQGLRDYHAAREKQGHELIKSNIETLRQLVELAIHVKDK